jgi:hypothetical protein
MKDPIFITVRAGMKDVVLNIANIALMQPDFSGTIIVLNIIGTNNQSIILNCTDNFKELVKLIESKLQSI